MKLLVNDSQGGTKRKKGERIKLTKRDFEILYLVYQSRFINTDQICAFIEGGSKGIKNRLTFLLKHNLLGKVDLGLITNHSQIYGLGQKGAELLGEELELPLQNIDWKKKNKEIVQDSTTVQHDLFALDIAGSLKLASDNKPNLKFIDQNEIIKRKPYFPKGEGKPLSMEVKRILKNNKILEYNMIPDFVCGFRGKTHKEAFFLGEADYKTMPITRMSSFKKTSYYKKMNGYYLGWKFGAYGDNWGFKPKAILTVTTSQERVDNMVEAQKKLDTRGKGLKFFLFANKNDIDIKKPDKVFKKIWTDGTGKKVSLIDYIKV